MTKVTQESKNIGNRLRKLREQKDLTQEELALQAGLNRAYIGYIERGERNPSTDTLAKLAKVLNVPLYEFFKFQ